MKTPPKPEIRLLLDGSAQVFYYQYSKNQYQKAVYTCQSEAEAAKVLMYKTASWILLPLLSWTKSQEHICSIMQISNVHRAKPLGNIHKQVAKLLSQPTTTPLHVGNWLLQEGLELFTLAMPGQSSRYYQGSLLMQLQLQRFATEYGIQEPIPEGQNAEKNFEKN